MQVNTTLPSSSSIGSTTVYAPHLMAIARSRGRVKVALWDGMYVNFISQFFRHVSIAALKTLEQGLATYGLWTKYSPQHLWTWPVKALLWQHLAGGCGGTLPALHSSQLPGAPAEGKLCPCPTTVRQHRLWQRGLLPHKVVGRSSSSWVLTSSSLQYEQGYSDPPARKHCQPLF